MYQPPERLLWPPELPRPSIDQIKSAVLDGMRCPIDNALHGGAKRKTAAALPRRIFSELCKNIRGMSTPEIADTTGMAAHSTYTNSGDWICQFCHSSAGIAAHNEIVKALIYQMKAVHSNDQ